MKEFKSTIYYFRVFADLCVLIISFLIAHIIINNNMYEISKIDVLLMILLVTSWFISAYRYNMYDEFRSRDFIYELILVIKNSITHLLISIIIIFLIDRNELPRKFILYYILVLIILVTMEKFLIRIALDYYRKKGRNLRTMLIIGAGKVGLNFYETVNCNPHFGYKILGFLDDKIPPNLNGEYIGPISELNKLLEEIKIDNVIVALPNYATQKIEEVIRICENHTTRVRVIPDYFRFRSSKFKLDMFGNFPIITVHNDSINDLLNRVYKRIFDIIFSLAVIILVLSWLLPILAILVKLTSSGPVFFKQERWGRDNKKFTVLKIRTMIQKSKDVDENGNYLQATKNDPRVTKIGRFLRKTNLDELPQFFNVLKGDMSVVGPRPHPIPLNLESKNTVDRYMLRHLVKPGITGWAQVNGCRGETKNNKNLMQKRVDYDLWYIENWSFWLDIQIIFMTILKMIKGDPNAY